MNPEPRPSIKGYIVVGALAVLCGILAIVFFASARRRDRYETCALNLRYLSMAIQSVNPADEKQWDDMPDGGAFWISHSKWYFRPVRPIRQETILCPVYASVKGRTGTDYRGPAKSLRLTENRDPIGADKPGNHGPGAGGHVLLKSGELYSVKETDPLWQHAAETTKE